MMKTPKKAPSNSPAFQYGNKQTEQPFTGAGGNLIHEAYPSFYRASGARHLNINRLLREHFTEEPAPSGNTQEPAIHKSTENGNVS